MRDLLFSRSSVGMIGGMKLVESIHATAKPKGVPRTDDMKLMVEHMDRLGLIQRVPAAFNVGDALLIHPVLLDKMRKRLAHSIEAEISRSMFYGTR